MLCLCGPLERHNRQILAPPMVVNVYRESIARLAGDKRLRPCASRRTRPVFARFDGWATIGGSLSEVDFIRRLASKRCMRALFVVPVDERNNLATACFSSLGNQYSSRALVLDRPDEAFDHGDASVLADGTIPRGLNALAFDPTSKCVAVEDAVTIADDVLRCGAGAADCSPQASAHIPATRPVGEDA